MCGATSADSFFFSSRRRHTRLQGDWSSDVCSSDLNKVPLHRLPPSKVEVNLGGEHTASALCCDLSKCAGIDVQVRIGGRGVIEQIDRKSGGEGKRVELGGRRIIKKKKKTSLSRPR